jgi:2-polyprenyl-3-methyl-5-hydroxy-6-metoxy-1,4-benzoquinol methylase
VIAAVTSEQRTKPSPSTMFATKFVSRRSKLGSPIDPEGTEITVIHELVDFSGADVLEVGCGDGRLTWRYAEQAATVLAMDMNEEKIERATAATPPSLRSKTSVVMADIGQVELSPDAYDVAILAHSL